MDRSGGDAFWRAFTHRTCEYNKTHYAKTLAKLAYLETVVKDTQMTSLPKCPACKINTNDAMAQKCAKCKKVLWCGREWCERSDTTDISCDTCQRTVYCGKCNMRRCKFEGCDKNTCGKCIEECLYCSIIRCKHHVIICPTCALLICAACTIHTCSTKRIKL